MNGVKNLKQSFRVFVTIISNPSSLLHWRLSNIGFHFSFDRIQLICHSLHHCILQSPLLLLSYILDHPFSLLQRAYRSGAHHTKRFFPF